MTVGGATNQRFQTTQWTQVRALADGDPAERQRAIDLLVERYWPPVYAHLRGRGLAYHDAADLTQKFFTHVVLGRNLFEQADRGKGRLRTLLLTSLKHFAVDDYRHEVVRGAGRTISMDAIREEEIRLVSSSSRDLPWSFEHRWALAVLEEALQRCETHFLETGKAAHWELFQEWVLNPACSGTQPHSFEDVAAQAGFLSAAQASSALQVVKIRMKALLHEVVGETVEDSGDVSAEVDAVKQYLAMV